MATQLTVLDDPAQGAPRLVRGCCPLDCQDTCSWVAHVEGGRVVRVEGAKDHPITRGALCAKVNDYQERTYAPTRILQPLRRTGRKGEGRFEPCTWDEALDEIARRLLDTAERHGAEAILPLNYLGSMGVLQRRALMRIFHGLGASRFHGSVCGAAGNAIEAEGHPRGFDPELMAEARYVLVWGSNPLTTAHHQWHFLAEARRRHGARIVVIDPIRTKSARAADEHVSIVPGTDAVLAAGFAHVLYRDSLVDRAFVDEVALDAEALEQDVARWTPERTASVTGVPAATIERIAREFGAARPGLVRGGVGIQQSEGGEDVVRALSMLAILPGHWKLPGGGLYIESGPTLDERRASRPDLGRQGVRSLDLARLGEHLTNPTLEPPIRALVVWGMNPAVTQPDAGRVREGLAREDLFTVVLEQVMSDTARYADIVLPSTTQLEHLDLQGSWGHHYISLNEPAIAPLGESRSHGDVLRALAPRLGLVGGPYAESDEAIMSATLPDGVSLDDLRRQGFVKRSPAPPRFGARLRLSSGPVEPPVAPPGRLRLLTPKSHYFLNTTFGEMPRQRAAMQRPTLELHPDEAAARGLADGQAVWVRNGGGRLRATLRITTDIHPGVAALPGKWSMEPAETSAVANLLTPAAYAPHGQPAFNDTWVEVLDATEATDVAASAREAASASA